MNDLSVGLMPRRLTGLAVAAIVLGGSLAACSADPGTGSQPTSGPVEITAVDEQFDATTLRATADGAFGVLFINNDGDEEHNFALYDDQGGGLIVASNVIEGGSSTEVGIPALPAGEYYFQCDIHPEMNGTLVIVGG